MRPFLLGVLLCALVASLPLIEGASASSWNLEKWFDTSAVGRVTFIGPDGKHHLCTGFVVRKFERTFSVSRYGFGGGQVTVDAYYVVTAGHCVKGGTNFRFIPANTRVMRWSGMDVVAMIVAGVGYDLAVLEVVESPYNQQTYAPLELDFDYEVKAGDSVLTVGYGRKALMQRVNTVLGIGEDGEIVIDGYASPGNSGGPVFSMETGKVIGIMSHTTIDVKGSPAVCALIGCGVKPPYYATPIIRLKRTVKMP